VSLSGVLAAYFGGGAVAGGVVGLPLPLSRTRAGAVLVAVIAALPVWIGIAAGGWPTHWGEHQWESGIVLSLIVGIAELRKS
jgi:hypothetical protein